MNLTRYFGNWSTYEEMVESCLKKDYNYVRREYPPVVIPESFPKDEEVIFAVYNTPAYEGNALIIFERDGKLFEINGSHCSCYGLEESMGEIEETSRGALKLRQFSPYDEYDDAAVDRFTELFK